MLSRVQIIAPAVILLFVVTLTTAYASIVMPWSIEKLANEAPLIVVGEVIDTAPTQIPPPHEEHGIRMQYMIAHIKILRLPQTSQTNNLTAGDIISLCYERYDPIQKKAIMSGYLFPILSPGGCYAFPLKTHTDENSNWQLINRQDAGLLVPCLKTSPSHVASNSTSDFLITELSSTFALSNESELARAADFLKWSINSSSIVSPLHERIDSILMDNESRWIDIAAFTYSSMGIPRPSLAELKTDESKATSAQSLLVAKALQHVSGENLDDKIIRATIRCMDVPVWGVGITLSQNYAHSDLAISLLIKRLHEDSGQAIDVSESLIQANPDKALVQAATEASMHVIMDPKTNSDTYMRFALSIIEEYGDDKQFDSVLESFTKSLKEDHERFFQMWQGLAYNNNKRSVPIIRIAIMDNTPWPNWQGMRMSDVAASELQRITKVSFGVSSKNSEPERDKALEKAKRWLAENP